jgi:aldehyde dehydrogenase family 7 protein A1
MEGKILNSERPGHFMMEMWNPLGNIGLITSFNMPVLVAGSNIVLSLVCGNLILWNGATSSSLCTIALSTIVTEVLKKNGFLSVLTVCLGDEIKD